MPLSYIGTFIIHLHKYNKVIYNIHRIIYEYTIESICDKIDDVTKEKEKERNER